METCSGLRAGRASESENAFDLADQDVVSPSAFCTKLRLGLRCACNQYVEGAICITLQIGSTPYAPRCSSMKAFTA
jgi:hypothetical protein